MREVVYFEIAAEFGKERRGSNPDGYGLFRLMKRVARRPGEGRDPHRGIAPFDSTGGRLRS